MRQRKQEDGLATIGSTQYCALRMGGKRERYVHLSNQWLGLLNTDPAGSFNPDQGTGQACHQKNANITAGGVETCLKLRSAPES